MPTYTYRCKNCSYEFEELQRITEDPLTECPSCHNHTLIRMIGGGAGLVFKGSGFYLTDYKKSPKKETKKPSGSKESKPDSTSGSKPSENGSPKSKDNSSSSSKE